MRVSRGLLAAGVALAIFVAGYLVGSGRTARPGSGLPPGTVPASPVLEPDSFGPQLVPAFADTMDRLLEDLDRRMEELRRRPGDGSASLEHAHRYYGQVQDGLRRLGSLTDPDSIAAVRRQVVMSYRAALKVLQVASGGD
jgi:hypothetical protein